MSKSNMSHRAAAGLLVPLVTVLVSSTGAADLSDNLSRATAGTETVTSDRWVAAAFTTGASASSLSSVTVLLARTSASGSAALEIRSDGGLEPGPIVAALAPPETYSSVPEAATFTTGGVALEGGKTYWVVLRAVEGTFEWAWTADNAGSGAGFSTAWDVSDDAGAAWFTHDVYPLQLRVTTGDAEAPLFLRGDCNSDGDIDLSDAVFLLLFNFVGGSTPACLAACDMDGDGQMTGTVTDAVYLLTYNFGGGSPPALPFPDCGTIDGRPGDEALGCVMGHPGC